MVPGFEDVPPITAEGGSITSFIVLSAVLIVPCIGLWKVFDKAGQKGWAAIISIYNIIILVKIVEKPCWWTLLYFIPIVNIIIGIIVACHLADHFDKKAGFKLGLVFLPFIFMLILGLDDSEYKTNV